MYGAEWAAAARARAAGLKEAAADAVAKFRGSRLALGMHAYAALGGVAAVTTRRGCKMRWCFANARVSIR